MAHRSQSQALICWLHLQLPAHPLHHGTLISPGLGGFLPISALLGQGCWSRGRGTLSFVLNSPLSCWLVFIVPIVSP